MRDCTNQTPPTKPKLRIATGTTFPTYATSKWKTSTANRSNSSGNIRADIFPLKCRRGTTKNPNNRRRTISKVPPKQETRTRPETISSGNNSPLSHSQEHVEFLTSNPHNLCSHRNSPSSLCPHWFFKGPLLARLGLMVKQYRLLINTKEILSTLLTFLYKILGFLLSYPMRTKCEICYWERKLKMLKLDLFKVSRIFGPFMWKVPSYWL